MLPRKKSLKHAKKKFQTKNTTTLKPSEELGIKGFTCSYNCLAEFVCTGCLDCIYKPFLYILERGETEDTYPDLEDVAKKLHPGGLRHTAPYVTKDHEHPEGFSHCGYYQIVRVYKHWEDPYKWEPFKLKYELAFKTKYPQSIRVSKDETNDKKEQ